MVTWNESSRRRTFRLPWYCFPLFRQCLTDHSAVSIPHPTEGAERDSWLLYCVLSGVHAALWWSLCSLPALFVFSLLPAICFFRRPRHYFEKQTQKRTSTPIHPVYRIWPVLTLPRKRPGGERFAVLHTHTVQLSSPSRSTCCVNFATTWHSLRPLHAQQLTNHMISINHPLNR